MTRSRDWDETEALRVYGPVVRRLVREGKEIKAIIDVLMKDGLNRSQATSVVDHVGADQASSPAGLSGSAPSDFLLLPALLGGCLGGCLLAALWVFLATRLEKELGFMALVIATLAGFLVLSLNRQQRGPAVQLAAAAAGLVAMVVGFYGIFLWKMQIDFDLEQALNQEAMEKFFTWLLAEPINLFWGAMGLFSAWRIPAAGPAAPRDESQEQVQPPAE